MKKITGILDFLIECTIWGAIIGGCSMSLFVICNADIEVKLTMTAGILLFPTLTRINSHFSKERQDGKDMGNKTGETEF